MAPIKTFPHVSMFKEPSGLSLDYKKAVETTAITLLLVFAMLCTGFKKHVVVKPYFFVS